MTGVFITRNDPLVWLPEVLAEADEKVTGQGQEGYSHPVPASLPKRRRSVKLPAEITLSDEAQQPQ